MKRKVNDIADSTQLNAFRAEIIRRFKQGEAVAQLIRQLSAFIDQLLLRVWQQQFQTDTALSLIAIGGYGRSELHLYSDIDILILIPSDASAITLTKIEKFIRYLWDTGLEVGHSTRTLNECVDIAKNDITVISNLIDSRLLQGNKQQYRKLVTAIQTTQMWPSDQFFQAKYQEQQQRYQKYAEASYNLEPNTKNGPGGLRDIQMITWLVKRHFDNESPQQLLQQQLLTPNEYEILQQTEIFLWRVRLAIHICANKREDRLLFDYQPQIAQLFGYQDKPEKLAIEQLMKDYYYTVKSSRKLNEILLQLLKEKIFNKKKQCIIQLNQYFQIRNHYIEVSQPQVFVKHPSAFLELFLLMSKHPEIQGIHVETIRLIEQHKQLINSSFRAKKENQKLFISLLQSQKPHLQLDYMNHYGVLGQYIPEFGQIIDQMQYDLFHIYTVDQHTIVLIRNLNYFFHSECQQKFPLCHNIIKTIKKPELLYIAGLFHDIAKGRGGDHSCLGSADAENFCLRHDLSHHDTELVAWLVQYHLILSQTAQRKDIYDPDTISIFIEQVRDKQKLDYLYLLTVADICATNPSLWNSWKDSLLKELYRLALQKLSQKTLSKYETIQTRKNETLNLLKQQGIESNAANQLWRHFNNSYFIYEPANSIAQHTQAILQHQNQQPLILIMPHHTQGGTQIFIYMPSHKYRFAITTITLANCHLNVLEARISTTHNGYSLDSYIVLDQNNKPIDDQQLLQSIKKRLIRLLTAGDKLPRLSQWRISRQQQHFNIRSKIQFQHDKQHQHTRLFLISRDRPGLLAQISRAFIDCNIHLQTAKINTAGERVEDIFYITDQNKQALQDKTSQEALRKSLLHYLVH